MIKTKHLTISKQKDIIKRVMNMEKFIKSDLNIETIVFACFVARGTGDAVHKNRPSHGLAFHTSGEKEYNFSDGTKLLTKPNTLIYLPKGSDYVVNTKVQGDCFAINFDISPQTDFKPFVMPVKKTLKCLNILKRQRKSGQQRNRDICLNVRQNYITFSILCRRSFYLYILQRASTRLYVLL